MAKDTVSVSDVKAWVSAGNFSHEGDVVAVEDLRSPKIFAAARAAYVEATTSPEEKEKRARKERESRTFTVVLLSGSGEVFATDSCPNDQRIQKETLHESFKGSLELLRDDDAGARLLVLVSDGNGVTVEGITPDALLDLIQR